MTQANWLDRIALAFSPSWGASRLRARAVAESLRHYEAVSVGRRTQHWNRSSGDANAVIGPALAPARAISRDLVRNNGWARNGVREIVGNTVGWGIVPKAIGVDVGDVWKRWANSTDCDADGRLTFDGLQELTMKTVVESGEALVRRRRRRPDDELPLPLQLQVLEPDFLDSAKESETSQAGGPIVQGVEFDLLGRRAAYWLFPVHPGSATRIAGASRRVPAEDIAHIYSLDRPGQVRGVPWLITAILKLKDFDEFEDAQLVRQKVAACFAAFAVDVNGEGSPLGEQDAANQLVETLEPGMVAELKPGQDVRFGNPPLVTEDGFSTRTLRGIAAALGVTYEGMTGDYSQVNFSSARMGRLTHWKNVHSWRWNMLIPQFCDPVWAWAMDAAVAGGLLKAEPGVEWTPPPMPMLEPDREGLALTRLVRGGFMTPSEAVRERGNDPETFYAEYAADLAKLDELGIWLDSDVRRTSQAGLTQERAGAGAKAEPDDSED